MKDHNADESGESGGLDIYNRPNAGRTRPREFNGLSDAPIACGPSLTYSSGKRASTVASNSAGSAGIDALDFLRMLAQELSDGAVELPCFPNIVLKIRDALNDPTTTVDNAARLIGAEPRLAARLLQTANSAALNHSGKRITELKIAITRLGQQLVQGVAMAFAVQQIKEAPVMRVIAEPLSDLWRRSIAVASICHVVSRKTSVPPDEAFLAGLLHGIGRLYIMVRATTKTGTFDQTSVLAELIEGWHASIGKSILENWELGDHLAQAVNDQFDYQRPKRTKTADLTDILIVSLALSEKLDDASKVMAIQDISSFQTIGLAEPECDAIIKHASYQIASLQDALGC